MANFSRASPDAKACPVSDRAKFDHLHTDHQKSRLTNEREKLSSHKIKGVRSVGYFSGLLRVK